MFKSCEKFINSVRAKRIANLRTVESDSHRAMFNSSVVRDVSEIEAGDDPPGPGIKNVRNFAIAHGFILSDQKVKTPFCHCCPKRM
jgi:hypothetical protein